VTHGYSRNPGRNQESRQYSAGEWSRPDEVDWAGYRDEGNDDFFAGPQGARWRDDGLRRSAPNVATGFGPTSLDDIYRHRSQSPTVSDREVDAPSRGSVRRAASDESDPAAPHPPKRLAGLAWFATGAGLCFDGGAITLAWRDLPGAQLLFWVAVLGPFVLFAIILAALQPSPSVRRFTALLIGAYPAVVYRMSSPFVLGGYDEHLHERTLNDLLHGASLFAPNPLLTVSPYYPGLELFTGLVARLTALPVMLAISLVVILCRLILVTAIYQGALAVTRSERSASLAVLFYAASPQFYFFNSQFSYQTLALALGLAGLTLLHRAQLKGSSAGGPRLAVMAVQALVATVVTHHATSWIFLAFMIVWALAAPRGGRATIACATAAMALSVAGWTLFNLHRLSAYMGPIMTGVIQQFGGNAHLFHDAAGTALPSWERLVLVFYSILCAAAAVICGWRVLKIAIRDRSRMLGFIGLLSLAYPGTLAAHFEPTLASYGDRASTFMFLPVALCCAIVIRGPKARSHRIRRRPRRYRAWLVGAASFAYLGGVILGSGPAWGYLPGPYMVSADSRTQDPETLAALRWAEGHLSPGSRIVADRTSADLLAADARLWPVFRPEKSLIPAALFFKVKWQSSLTTIVRGLGITYIYVDQRLGDSLPQDGYYISRGETAGPVQIAPAALRKFASVPGITAIYHDGPITIYDAAGLGLANEVTGFVGSRRTDLGEPLSVAFGVVAGCLGLLVIYRRRRQPRRVERVEETDAFGLAVSAVAAAIFISAMLFAFRAIPGPGFILSATAIVLPAWTMMRSKARRRRRRVTGVGSAIHPLMLVGTCAVAGGLFLGLHAAWANQVVAVSHIVQAARPAQR
jgi:hypothetical protein